jgi:hypothetical protein
MNYSKSVYGVCAIAVVPYRMTQPYAFYVVHLCAPRATVVRKASMANAIFIKAFVVVRLASTLTLSDVLFYCCVQATDVSSVLRTLTGTVRWISD